MTAPKPVAAPVNPTVAEAATRVRARRTRTAAVPTRLYDSVPGQLSLFDPHDQQESQP
ncbi:hypothetical protein ACL02S_16375 [Nocardia sp. 004]|uniref:hypothetical protein n=1 Tax=Nocardia sp. 004 TaxID=3385978 RepID=UPI0039A01F5E